MSGSLALRVKLRAYLEAARPYTLFHAGTLALASGLVATDGHLNVGRAALIWFTPTTGWLAGLATSDYFDRELDRIEKPHRPIPSGRIGQREALLLMIGLIAAGFLLSLALSWRVFLLAWVVMLLGIAYARLLKARGFLGHLDRGMLAVCTVIFGSIAATGGISSSIVPLVIVFFFHDTFTNLLGAVRDVEGDQAAGYRTVPVRYGVPFTLVVACTLLLVWGSALAIVAIRGQWPILSLAYGGISLCLALSALIAIAWSQRDSDEHTLGTRSPRRQRALRAHKLLVGERLLLSNAFLASTVSIEVSVLLVAVLVVPTLWAQFALRDQYEFAQLHLQPRVGDSDVSPRLEEEDHEPAGACPWTA
ncbi:MAG: UbiA family prenyltransferase [Chloroflexi bacterium]|nr:UbiA family prenyltransferase [Chloroflexota bacterium]